MPEYTFSKDGQPAVLLDLDGYKQPEGQREKPPINWPHTHVKALMAHAKSYHDTAEKNGKATIGTSLAWHIAVLCDTWDPDWPMGKRDDIAQHWYLGGINLLHMVNEERHNNRMADIQRKPPMR